jgi:hypothetical protein
MAEAVPLAYEWLLALAPWESPEVLEQSLQTLAQQTWPAQRLVVSVDGELPKPLAAVLQATPLPLLVLEAPGWRGTGPTLARGLEACRCDWVLRADADDDSHPQRAEQQLRHLQKQPWVCVLGGQLKEHAGSPHPVERVRHVPTEPEHLQGLLHWRNPLNHPTVALRRDAVLRVGNYRNAPGFEDWDLWLRLSKRGYQLCNLGEVLVTARVGPGHLRRRHGWGYAKREAGFLWRCGKEQLLPRHRVALLLLLRLPWRLLPAPWLEALMHGLRSRG